MLSLLIKFKRKQRYIYNGYSYYLINYENLINSSQLDNYPNYFKTYILHSNKKFNFNELSNICTDIGCEWCCDDNKCKICKLGYFLYQGKCYTICPKNYIADIFKRSCITLDSNSIDKLKKIL